MTEEKKQPQEEKAQEEQKKIRPEVVEKMVKYFKEQVILDNFDE